MQLASIICSFIEGNDSLRTPDSTIADPTGVQWVSMGFRFACPSRLLRGQEVSRTGPRLQPLLYPGRFPAGCSIGWSRYESRLCFWQGTLFGQKVSINGGGWEVGRSVRKRHYVMNGGLEDDEEHAE